MKYRKFSDLGWNVSEVGLGCMGLGWSWGDLVSENDARELLKKAVDKGVNFFDTSDAYGDGRSEKLLGELKRSTSEKLFITTKVGQRNRSTNLPRGYKEKHIEEFVDRSLIKLGTDCIDLLQLHCPPSEICSKKETYEMVDEIVKKGKIAHYGVSVLKISDAMEAIQFPNVKSIQIVFNIFRQKPAEAFLKEAKKKNIGIIVRGPLASGLLTGNINQNTKFLENDHRNYNISGEAFDVGDTFSGVNLAEGIRAVEKLKELLPDNFSLTELALKWILMHDEVSVVIPGAVNKSQVQMNTKASDLEDVSYLLPKINSIYNELIKPDVHHRW
jgi:aryl-alcohol dehydrogenase-like predicted oxidoreductase